MSWNIELGASGYKSKVFYNDTLIGGIQKLKIVTTAEGLTQMELTVSDSRLKVKGTPHDSVIINGKKVKLETCTKCIEAEKVEKRIIKKGW